MHLLRGTIVLALPLLTLFLDAAAPARAETVITTIAVGTSPQGVAVNPSTNLVYVANSGSNSVSVIDGSSNATVATIGVGTNPQRLAVDTATDRVYVTNLGSDNVSVIDGGSNTVIATVPVGSHPLGVAVNPSTNRIYVGNADSNSVSVIDGATNTVVATIPFASGPDGLAVNPATNRLYVVTTGAEGVLSVVDGATNSVVATLPSGSNSAEVAVDSTTNRFYVTNTMIGNVSVFDGATNTLIVSIQVGQPPAGTQGVAVNPTTNHIYVTGFGVGTNSVSEIDGNTNTVIATLPFNTGVSGVAANSATNRVYVTVPSDNSVSVIQDSAAPPPPPPTVVSTFFFAEGSTQSPFQTWFLVQNSTGNQATVHFTFQLEDGTSTTRDFSVGPTSRFSLFVNQILPNVAFSTKVESDQQILVERSMFVSFDGDAIAGIPAPNKSWLFAEGSTLNPFQTWVLIQNPNSVPANTTITYLLPDQPPVVQSLGSLAPTSRTSVFVNQVLPSQEFAVRVDSDQPIIAERALYRFPGNAASDTAGAIAASPAWFFAQGSSQTSPLPTDTFLLLENPQQPDTTVSVDMFSESGVQASFQIAMPGNSRRTIYLNDFMANQSFGFRVNSTQPIVAERSQFFGTEPRGVTGSLGATSLAMEWDLAEGSTQPPFTTVIAVLNPNNDNMVVRTDFELESGQVVSKFFGVGPNRKLSIDVNSILPNNAFSTKVTTSLPSVVERTMFLAKEGSTGATNVVGTPH